MKSTNAPLRKLAGLPPALPLEAPSSWVSRAALSQGVKPSQLVLHFGLPKACDVDMAFSKPAVVRALRACGIEHSFDAAVKIYRALRRVDSAGARFLLPTLSGRARYRFCPRCLVAPVAPHFGLHCRFAAWRYCPDHQCLLEEACPHCQSPVLLPADMVGAGPQGQGIAYLSQCQACAKSLATVEAVELQALALTEWERAFLNNGRASMSSLFYGAVRFRQDRNLPLRELRRLAKLGFLPIQGRWLEPAAVRRRLQAGGDDMQKSVMNSCREQLA